MAASTKSCRLANIRVDFTLNAVVSSSPTIDSSCTMAANTTLVVLHRQGLFAPPTIDLSSSGLKEIQQPEFEGYGVNVNKSVSENSLNEIKKTTGAPIIEDWVSDCDEDESEVMVSDNVQHKSEPKPEQAKQPRKINENPRNNRTN
ncbi:hypothetical protein Tco_0612297 [Tanacetum coccineum]